jgi:amino acid adenylation domain-containing protein
LCALPNVFDTSCRRQRDAGTAILEWGAFLAIFTPQCSNVVAGLVASAEAAPDAVALFETATSRSTSYERLVQRVGGIAAALNAVGIGDGTIVAVYAPRSADAVTAILGVLAAGAAFLPLDVHMPPARTRAIVMDAKPALALIGSNVDVHEQFGGVPVRRIDSMPSSGTIPPRKESLAYLIFTSGSTGTPKGVAVHDRSLANYLRWCNTTLTFSGGGSPLIGSLAYDHGMTALFPPLFHAEPLDIFPDGAAPRALLERRRDMPKYSYIKVAPSYLRMLTRPERALVGAIAESVVLGGEALHKDLVDDVRSGAPGVRIINHYGPTETTVGCCAYETPLDIVDSAVPIGTPIEGTLAEVVGDDATHVAAGDVGELLIGGASVALGYWNRPDLTNERFFEKPDASGRVTRWFRTGDRVRRLEDGNLVFVGRADDQIKILGHRVEPGEVEHAVRGVPGVVDACVFGISRSWGAELVAAVVPDDDATDLAADLRRHLSSQLPPAMIPSRFVFYDELPAKANGKVDRGTLLDATTGHIAEGDIADRTLMKWRELLQDQHIDFDDDFFELGGDSIAAMELSFWAMDALAVEIAPTAVFDYSTPRQFVSELVRIRESAGR